MTEHHLKVAFKILDNLLPGEIITISDYANGKDDLFLQCAEQYNKTYNNLELNPSRNKIKKYESIRRHSEIAPTDCK